MLRKTSERYQHIGLLVDASMRPQRNAAENAEIDPANSRWDAASMRPQRNAAENRGRVFFQRPIDAASMRPQRNAAENSRCGIRCKNCAGGFNEAAA